MLLGRLAVFAYLVWDEEAREGMLVDPAFETGRVLTAVQKAGYRVKWVVNTHHHTDHSSGNAAILAATGAGLAIHRADARRLRAPWNRAISRVLGGAGSPAPDRLLEHGDELELGSGRVRVIHTPGHTQGGISLYIPGHVFTGDSLFVGCVGRTDLPGGNGETLLSSIRERLYTLPEDTTVWPGHHYGDSPRSTIAREKAENPFTR
ncbi:MAG: MBL fold metallo-hydrolase [Proteobacteria bacterium]|nr:MBL fold metallo-hydrolase [Pseudomonadota bacterium]